MCSSPLLVRLARPSPGADFARETHGAGKFLREAGLPGESACGAIDQAQRRPGPIGAFGALRRNGVKIAQAGGDRLNDATVKRADPFTRVASRNPRDRSAIFRC
jgi:hypothetical protein